jgi:rhodanese-related sulfurtransferase
MHTPGHRPEHTAFALIDRARGLEPWAVLSGDTLFVGDIARPDLAVEKEEGAHGIFHSLHDTLLALPGECEVWPGHVGGSLCGGPSMDMKVSSTIAFERRHNRLLQLEDEDAFVRAATAQLRPQPPNFQEIVAINRGPLRTGGLDPPPLATGDIERKQATGALLVDVRDDHAYDAAHIPGAVCNPVVRAGFGTKLAWIASRDQEIMLVGEGDADAAHAAQLAVSVGIDRVAGYLKGGMRTWHALSLPTDSLARIDVTTLHARRQELQVLDVRERQEWEEGHIPGSVHVPYHDVSGMPAGIDPDRPVAVICASGQRSAVAASLLALHGAGHVVHVAGGGVGTWRRNGWPITQAETSVTA